MLGYVQFYLKEGFIYPNNENLPKKKLIANTSKAFVDFMDSFEKFHDFNKWIIKKDFIKEYHDETKETKTTSHTLTKFTKNW